MLFKVTVYLNSLMRLNVHDHTYLIHLLLYLVQHGVEDLFFCFCWLLVSFKREFNYEDVMRIWEV